jgi:hypothetical protein
MRVLLEELRGKGMIRIFVGIVDMVRDEVKEP